jgi:catecholate siderophore receptor
VGAELDGSAANYGGLNLAAQIFGPERNKAVEIGTKWELFDKRLLVTGALFQTTKDNAREIVGTQVTANAAYRVQGIDLEVAGKITDRWSIIGGLVLMNTKVTNSSVLTNVGLPLANIAHQSFSLLTKYDVTDMFTVGGQAIYRSRVYGGSLLAANGGTAIAAIGTSTNTIGVPAPSAANPFLNIPTVLPSYWRFDAFAEAKIGPNFNLKAGVINMFNRTYYDAFYQSAAPFALIAPGRSFYLEARAKF